MYIVQKWLLVVFLACTLCVSTSPVATDNWISLSNTNKIPIDVNQRITNLSGIPGIPTDFKLQRQWGPILPVHLPNKAYFYSAIRAAEILALEDWDGVMGNRDFETTKYPQLRITTNTRYGTIPRKYVIWGLLVSCGLMDRVSGFGWVFFDVQWQGREVGGIAFTLTRNPAPPQLDSESPSNTTEETEQNRFVSSDHSNITYSTALSDTSTSQTGLTVPSIAGIVSATFKRHGGPLDEENIYMIILLALVQAAEQPNGRRITSFRHSEFDDYDTEMYTNQQPPNRSARPYYTFEVLIKTLALCAQYMNTENRLYETGMMSMVDGDPVGLSLLRHVRTESDQGEISTA